MTEDYLLTFKGLENKSDGELISELQKKPGLKVSGLKISHLVYKDSNFNEPILYGNGVYIFKDSHSSVYVGSCISRNFVERIPPHLDVRDSAMLNNLVKKISIKREISLQEAVKYLFIDCSLLLINFEKPETSVVNWKMEVASKILGLEKKLIRILKPLFN
jgi:hypothetical protein